MKNKTLTFLMGLLCGMMLLSGGYAAANTVLTASPSTQTFYVDGRQIQFEAYVIHGNNFVKLRDIGRAVNFGVEYDATTNSVQINTNSCYREEVPLNAPSTPTPQTAVTTESVQAVLASLRERYPNGTQFPAPYRSTSNGPYYSGMNCAGWATLCSDAAFGNLPWRRIDNPNWDQIRVGDLVEYDNNLGGHVIVVVNKTADALYFTDSGPTQKAYWGGKYFRSWLEEQPGLILYTRYPYN